MKIAVVVLIIQAALVQHCFSQCIRNAPLVSPQLTLPVATCSSVANSLADTLSLLTVSSLLAESLPLNPTVIATMPVPMAPAVAPVVSGYGIGGCGCGISGIRECGCGISGIRECGCGISGIRDCGCGITGIRDCGCGITGIRDCGCGITGVREYGISGLRGCGCGGLGLGYNFVL